MATKDGGPAFPILDIGNTQCEGLSIRDYFAAKALSGILGCESTVVGYVDENTGAAWPNDPNEFRESVASAAYAYADAMLAAREVQP